MDGDSSRMLRYCGIPICKNFRGTTDENIGFFKVPRKGSGVRSVWMMNLSTDADVRKTFNDIEELCMLHFKTKHLDLEMQNGKPIYSLKKGAVPLPLNFIVSINQQIRFEKKPKNTVKISTAEVPIENGVERATDENEQVGDTGQGEVVEDVKFVDMTEFRNISCDAIVKPELMIHDDIQPSTLKRLNDTTCSSCMQLAIQSQNDNKKLQKAKMIIKELEKQVVELKLKIQYLERPKREATVAAVKAQKLFANDTHIRENQTITIVNVEDIKPKISGQETTSEIPMSTAANQENLNNSTVVQSSTAINRSETVDRNKKLYTCKKCDEPFTSMKKLVNHLRTVKQHRVLFECFICKWNNTYSEKTMRNHIKRHEKTPQKRFRRKCLVCLMLCHSAADLDSHLCGDKVDIQCEYCDEHFTATTELCEHLTSVHQSSQRFYRCSKCPKYFPMIFLKDCHENVHSKKNSQSELLNCDTCSKQFFDKKTFTDHKRFHNRPNALYLCDLCGKSFKSITSLEAHMQSSIHSQEPTIQCPSCPRKFYSTTHFKRHFSRLHTEQKWKCDICGKCLNSIDGHKKHMKRHNRTKADRQFACKLCPMKFFEAEYLRRHEIKHLGIKQFHCHICTQSYKYKGDLQKHLRSHFEDGKIHECAKCSMRFKYFAELEKHSFEHYKDEKSDDVQPAEMEESNN